MRHQAGTLPRRPRCRSGPGRWSPAGSHRPRRNALVRKQI
ncbi:hypothetical protein HDA35_005834 [Micromonospora purpureochromogenes]|uniref:Uncharacterized protein n=1 Tax=Micromonospora purpureochromogenes TaxID=47872 RepID=A0ABX2RTY2_9ACTN|nr:hypothetical protein [Micromonospora purpureochromogenes]